MYYNILPLILNLIEPRHDKTNLVGLQPAWIQTSLRIRAVWSGSMLFAVSFSTCNRVGKRTSWILIRLRGSAMSGLDPCWSQTQYVGFVVTRLNYYLNSLNGNNIHQFSCNNISISNHRFILNLYII
jgi:hypothetical protein